GEYRNASELAAAANVSVMSAFRFVRQLRMEAFLDESRSNLRVVRLDDLLRRWQAESQRPSREVPMRWILRGDPERQLRDALRARASEAAPRPSRARRAGASPARLCLGLFAEAAEFGHGFAPGLAPPSHVDASKP